MNRSITYADISTLTRDLLQRTYPKGKALCIRADSDFFRVGESYDIVRIDHWEDTVHIATGNYFDDVLVCGRTMYEGIVAAKVENEENIYVFDICERRQKRESKRNTAE